MIFTESIAIKGDYFIARSSKAMQANLTVNGHVISILSDDTEWVGDIILPIQSLQVDDQIAQIPRTFKLPNGDNFVCLQSQAVNSLAKKIKPSSSLKHYLESHWYIVLLAIISTIIALILLLQHGVPSVSKTIAFSLPETDKTSDFSLQLLDEAYFKPSSLSIDRQNAILTLLKPYQDQLDIDTKVHFRQFETANAFALMSRDIIFTDKLIRLAEDDTQVLAVFFHEVGHLHQRHFLRRLIQDSLLTVLLILVLGNIDVPDLLFGLPSIILGLSYSKAFELEADHFAVEQLKRFNIPPSALSSILDRLSTQDEFLDKTQSSLSHQDELLQKLGDYMSSHPSNKERMELINQ